MTVRLHGLEITEDWSQARATGTVIANVKVKHMWRFMFYILRTYGIPWRYWPLFFWQYYTKREVKEYV